MSNCREKIRMEKITSYENFIPMSSNESLIFVPHKQLTVIIESKKLWIIFWVCIRLYSEERIEYRTENPTTIGL